MKQLFLTMICAAALMAFPVIGAFAEEGHDHQNEHGHEEEHGEDSHEAGGHVSMGMMNTVMGMKKRALQKLRRIMPVKRGSKSRQRRLEPLRKKLC